MSIPGSANPLLLQSAAEAGGYTISRSVRFNSADSAYLSKTFGSAGNRKTWTLSTWVKRSKLGTTQNIFQSSNESTADQYLVLNFDSSDRLFMGGGPTTYRLSTARFRDVSAWYHVVLQWDTTQATAADRVRLYVNGSQLTTFDSSSDPSQNFDGGINRAKRHSFGVEDFSSGVNFLDAYLADAFFIDGQALDPTSFGEFDDNGIWQPKEFTPQATPNDGTTWSNDLSASSGGAYFASGSGAAKAFNGDLNSSAITEPNGSTMTYSPSGGLTVNSSLRIYRGSDTTSNTVNVSVNGGSSITLPKQSWLDLGFTGTLTSIVVSSPSANPAISAIEVDGVILIDGNTSNIGVNGFHLDFSDNSTAAALGTDSAGSNDWTVNNITANAPGITTANQYFDVVTYTGNGGTQTISGLAFSPDFVWIKRRNSAGSHSLFDAVRGATKRLVSDSTAAETTETTALTAFTSDGFTLGSGGTANGSGDSFVAWCWSAGDSTVSNTDGSITSSVRANPSAGFSIVSYTGSGANATVGHGLGVAPAMIMFKKRSATQNWVVYHSAMGATKALYLDQTVAAVTSSNFFQDTQPTSSVFSLGTGDGVNTISQTFIAYCFAPVAGYSAFGSYTGNGSTDGPVVVTGFKPKWILLKTSNAVDGWRVYDTARSPSNPAQSQLFPNLANAEVTSSAYDLDILSNGFKLRTSNTDFNGSGDIVVYAAFAGTPAGEEIDALLDVPTNGTETDTGVGGEVRGNYCTWNPLDINSTGSLSNGNSEWTAVNGNGVCRGTIAVSSGKWYFEFTYDQKPSGGGTGFGILDVRETRDFIGGSNAPRGYSYYSEGSSFTKKYYNGTNADYGASFAPGDVIGVALDLDGGTITFYKNGTSQGQAYSSVSGTFAPAVTSGTSVGTAKATLNTGARSFAYTAPSGFKALNTANLPSPVVTKPSTVMDVKLYTGNSSTQTISGLEFSPDLVFTKQRDSNRWPAFWDTVRGATKWLKTAGTDAEFTNAQGLTAFNSDGFTLGTQVEVNASGGSYVAWTWDAGSSTVTNTQGSITSSVRANPSAGFSIVTYTGNGVNTAQTIGHGLNAKPGLIILKGRDQSFNWMVLHQSFTDRVGKLNTTDAFDTGYTSYGSGAWNPNGITSSTFSTYPGTSNSAYPNANGLDYVAYCFAPVAGYSSFGSYVGNGSADGSFVYTGFRPKFVMIKCSTAVFDWRIFDTSRSDANGANVVNYKLYPNTSGAENGSGGDNSSTNNIDILSNGFKLRTANGATNDPQTYIYCAFAESPFQYARAR